MQLRTRPGLIATICAAAALLALPQSAMADLWVDNTTGDDGSGVNQCTDQSTPCKTIQHAVNSVTPDHQIVHVDDDATVYAENVNLSSPPLAATTLVEDNFVAPDEPRALINGGTGTAITVSGDVGEIRGFEIQGNTRGISAAADVTIRNNLFSESAASSTGVASSGASTAVSIVSNVFSDSTPTDSQTAIQVSSSSAMIEDNQISGYQLGIHAPASPAPKSLNIRRNAITGTHRVGMSTGQGMVFIDATGEIVENLIHQPGPAVSGALADAVQVFGAADPTFKRNAFLDHRFGLLVDEADATLEGDLIANNASTGFGIDCDAGTCTASASNVTFFGNGQDVFVDDTQLTLDSSIVGDPISADQSTCAIAYSRGPTTTSGGDGCQAFQTTADPAFVNPAGDDFHLQPGSPMIDAGNPVAPVPGVIDRDGDPRALDGNCDGPAIRDIGYDEVVADCTPPSPGPDPGSGDTNPPDTTITEKPKDKTKSKTATFAFISSEAGSTFDCSLDGKATFKPCTSPLKVKVKKGKHSFAVQATDAAGNTDPTPATDSWKVKKKKK